MTNNKNLKKKFDEKKSFRVPLFATGSAMTAIFCRP
jgi:hypothetical protein